MYRYLRFPTCLHISWYFKWPPGGFRNHALAIGWRIRVVNIHLASFHSALPTPTMSLAVRLAARSSLSPTVRACSRSFASSARCFQAVETSAPAPSHTATKQPLTKTFKIYRWVRHCFRDSQVRRLMTLRTDHLHRTRMSRPRNPSCRGMMST